MFSAGEDRFKCPDCGTLGGDFMVKDEVWLSVFESLRAGRYCIQCFARRLGRPVERDDLKMVPSNYSLFYMFDRGFAKAKEVKRG